MFNLSEQTIPTQIRQKAQHSSTTQLVLHPKHKHKHRHHYRTKHKHPLPNHTHTPPPVEQDI